MSGWGDWCVAHEREDVEKNEVDFALGAGLAC